MKDDRMRNETFQGEKIVAVSVLRASRKEMTEITTP